MLSNETLDKIVNKYGDEFKILVYDSYNWWCSQHEWEWEQTSELSQIKFIVGLIHKTVPYKEKFSKGKS